MSEDRLDEERKDGEEMERTEEEKAREQRDPCRIFRLDGTEGLSKGDMTDKLKKVSPEMFPVSGVEKETTREVPAAYDTYKEKEVTVITKKVKEKNKGKGKKKTRYRTAKASAEQFPAPPLLQTPGHLDILLSRSRFHKMESLSRPSSKSIHGQH